MVPRMMGEVLIREYWPILGITFTINRHNYRFWFLKEKVTRCYCRLERHSHALHHTLALYDTFNKYIQLDFVQNISMFSYSIGTDLGTFLKKCF